MTLCWGSLGMIGPKKSIFVSLIYCFDWLNLIKGNVPRAKDTVIERACLSGHGPKRDGD